MVKTSTLGTVAVVGGLAVAGYLLYNMFMGEGVVQDGYLPAGGGLGMPADQGPPEVSYTGGGGGDVKGGVAPGESGYYSKQFAAGGLPPVNELISGALGRLPPAEERGPTQYFPQGGLGIKLAQHRDEEQDVYASGNVPAYGASDYMSELGLIAGLGAAWVGGEYVARKGGGMLLSKIKPKATPTTTPTTKIASELRKMLPKASPSTASKVTLGVRGTTSKLLPKGVIKAGGRLGARLGGRLGSRFGLGALLGAAGGVGLVLMDMLPVAGDIPDSDILILDRPYNYGLAAQQYTAPLAQAIFELGDPRTNIETTEQRTVEASSPFMESIPLQEEAASVYLQDFEAPLQYGSPEGIEVIERGRPTMASPEGVIKDIYTLFPWRPGFAETARTRREGVEILGTKAFKVSPGKIAGKITTREPKITKTVRRGATTQEFVTRGGARVRRTGRRRTPERAAADIVGGFFSRQPRA